MDFYTYNQIFSNLESIVDDRFLGNLGGFNGDCGKSSQSLVLDDEKGELVKGQPKIIGKKIELMSDEKSLAALKSHSDAERRRRERINAHLDTLRGLVPSNDKMDKATLLAEVIRQVKQLKINATQARTGLLIPEDTDELIIEKHSAVNGGLTFHASFCCKNRPELLTDVRQSLAALKVKIERAEMSTLGDHIKMVFYFTKTSNGTSDEDIITSIRDALNLVIEKGSISPEYSPRTTLPNKRRRYSL
ncbi:hypothetical protein L2E82_14923 [Cichorium intybus]|uniref:Uncharacterized protein n=1 Tax=Cichorium intybus TaxID=13427 RepID=A0ACB9F2I4_CICIN|nr:hypothetical protein L2E82_14923 [Cichorium intybus]